MTLRTPNHTLTFPRRALIMGIVNLNDDSFSGDGTLDPSAALEIARQQIQNGADVIDLGAESARTNREAISVEEEVRRLRSFLAHWPALRDFTPPADSTQVHPPLLSINTWRPEVVAQILSPAVDLLNDMSALPDDQNARLCAQHGVPLLIMHSVGLPKVAHTHQKWDNLIPRMLDFFAQKIALAQAAGLTREQIILDPGLDFAKQKDDNLNLLRHLEAFHAFRCPILLPISRKTVIGEVLQRPNPLDRDPGTLALLSYGLSKGAHLFRVHNVRANFEALKVLSPFHQRSLKITLNLALSADAKISTTSLEPSPFTSKNDLQRLLQIRQQVDAILVGRGTLEADSMTLTCPDSPRPQPWRCIISHTGQFNSDHPVFHQPGGPIHLISPHPHPTPNLPATYHQTDLPGFLDFLKNHPAIKTLLCEGGGTLVKELFKLDLVDEINLTWAPHTLLGGHLAPTLTGLPGDFLPASRHYTLTHFEPTDQNEVFLTYHKRLLASPPPLSDS